MKPMRMHRSRTKQVYEKAHRTKMPGHISLCARKPPNPPTPEARENGQKRASTTTTTRMRQQQRFTSKAYIFVNNPRHKLGIHTPHPPSPGKYVCVYYLSTYTWIYAVKRLSFTQCYACAQTDALESISKSVYSNRSLIIQYYSIYVYTYISQVRVYTYIYNSIIEPIIQVQTTARQRAI